MMPTSNVIGVADGEQHGKLQCQIEVSDPEPRL
jgi:hypothetical protein